MAYTNNTRLIDMTVGELLEAVETRVKRVMAGEQTEAEPPADPPQPEQPKKRYVYGLDGLKDLLGCSKSTASRIKKSGKIDEAITQVGQLIIIDAEKALQLAGNEINNF